MTITPLVLFPVAPASYLVLVVSDTLRTPRLSVFFGSAFGSSGSPSDIVKRTSCD